MQIVEIRSTKIVLFSVDTFDMPSLSTEIFAKRMHDSYGFSKVQAPVSLPLSVMFLFGRIEIDGSEKIIDRITIEHRKIVFTMGGSLADIEQTYVKLLSTIMEFETRYRVVALPVPVVQVYETTITARFEFIFSKLIEKSIAGNLSRYLEAIDNTIPGISLKVTPASLKYKVEYLGQNDGLSKNSITMSEKLVSIEIKDGISPEEKLYVVSAPTTSPELINIIQQLETQAVM